MGDVSFAVIYYLFACHFVVLQALYLDHGYYLFAEFLVRHTDHLGVLNSLHFK